MQIKGKAHRFEDNVSTDDIIAGKYKNRILDMQELTKHLMENLKPDFYTQFQSGDLIVGGKNFGTGSSREAAPRVILAAGCRAVLARSFARIFFRNSFNVGLLLLECNTESIEDGDFLTIDTERDEVENLSKNTNIPFKPPPHFMTKVINDGGLTAHFKKHGGFVF
jgi:3-isopropylmalate/(R)-2-methylmalate dehydratase small subunit